MNNSDNPYGMTCLSCGRPLVPGHLSQTDGYGVQKIVDAFSNWSSITENLVCPQNHRYQLINVKQYIRLDDIKIREDVVERLRKDNMYNLDLANLISDPETIIYAVLYGIFTKIKSDIIPFARKPSPSNDVLDNVKMYICGHNLSNSSKKDLVFALVSEKENRHKVIYKIVWYYSQGGKYV